MRVELALHGPRLGDTESDDECVRLTQRDPPRMRVVSVGVAYDGVIMVSC